MEPNRRYKAKYTIPMAVGATFTTVGFCFKIWSSYHPELLGPWITAVVLLCEHQVFHYESLYAEQVSLVTAPPIYSAADYFIFAKTLYVSPKTN